MAWFTEQILSDFLNRWGDHSLVSLALSKTLADDAIMKYGTQTFTGKTEILAFLESMSSAISSDTGFTARPVILVEDSEGNSISRKAVALCSKLEEYVSWFYCIKGNSNFQIDSITGIQGTGYSYRYDYYIEGNLNYSEYVSES